MTDSTKRDELTARRRAHKPKYMVRFWTNQEAYEKFKSECTKRGVIYQDFFADCMRWFVEGKIK